MLPIRCNVNDWKLRSPEGAHALFIVGSNSCEWIQHSLYAGQQVLPTGHATMATTQQAATTHKYAEMEGTTWLRLLFLSDKSRVTSSTTIDSAAFHRIFGPEQSTHSTHQAIVPRSSFAR